MKNKTYHGWNIKTQRTLCGVVVNLKYMNKALHPESDSKRITCKKCKPRTSNP